MRIETQSLEQEMKQVNFVPHSTQIKCISLRRNGLEKQPLLTF